MTFAIGGMKATGGAIGGMKITGGAVGGVKFSVASDEPGRLSVSVQRSGRNYNFTFSVSDPNGIRSITSATARASDGTNADATGDFVRRNANTFTGTDSRRNARWARGTMSVTYVDNTSGASHTLQQSWSI